MNRKISSLIERGDNNRIDEGVPYYKDCSVSSCNWLLEDVCHIILPIRFIFAIIPNEN